MKHKRLERLALFAEVAEHLSYSKAAEALGLSKGHLSEQVKKLEQDYGTPLIVRTTRHIRLTTEGEKALESIQEIKHLLSNFERNLQRLDGTIRITAPKLFAEKYLSDIIASFRKQHPDVSFDINTSYERFNLSQAHFDMAFRATQQLPPENLVAKKLFSYRHTIAASPDYLANSEKLNEVTDLSKHQCLTADTSAKWQFKSGLVDMSSSIACNDNMLLKKLALTGEGVIRLPSFYLEEELAQDRLKAVLENECDTVFDLYLLYPTTTRETARLRQFTHFVTDYFEKLAC